MPWQSRAANVALEVGPDGRYWYRTIVITVPRQAGKTKFIGDIADHRCLTLPAARVWLTQQTGKDASAWMRDEHFSSLGRATPLAGRYQLSRRAGSEGVYWPHNGSWFRAFPPLRDALHGKQGDLIFADEVWALNTQQGADLRQAVRPTMATRPGAQLWVVSTVGDDQSGFLDGYLSLGQDSINDPTSRVCYIDYGIDEHTDPEDLQAVAKAHPAYGHTIDLDALNAARTDFAADPAGWSRAYGNRPTRARVAAFDPTLWAKAGTEPMTPPDHVGLAFDVTPSGDRTAVAAAWRDTDGHAWIEIIDSAPGSTWLRTALGTRSLPIGYDTAGIATLAAADELAHTHRGRLTGLDTVDVATACAVLAREVDQGTLRHTRQPSLNDAVACAARRPIRDGGWAWGRKASTGNIAPLVAATLALRIHDTSPRPRITLPMTPRK